MSSQKLSCISENLRFPGGTPEAISTKMYHGVSGTDHRACVKFHPNPFSSFRGDASRTDRQTDKQTNSKLNIRHCHEGDNYLSLCELARLAADTLLIYCWLLVVEVVLVVAVLSMPVARWRL